MLVKVIILAMLTAVLVALGSAVFAMLGARRDHTRMARALTWRIGLSVLLFVLLLAGFASGVLQPHPAIPPNPMVHNQ
jgi:uncharacterized membrane protein YsdA (DUF1294 family)